MNFFQFRLGEHSPILLIHSSKEPSQKVGEGIVPSNFGFVHFLAQILDKNCFFDSKAFWFQFCLGEHSPIMLVHSSKEPSQKVGEGMVHSVFGFMNVLCPV